MYTYEVALAFTLDRALTEEEIGDLAFGVELEAREPNDAYGEDAGWSGQNVTVLVKKAPV